MSQSTVKPKRGLREKSHDLDSPNLNPKPKEKNLNPKPKEKEILNPKPKEKNLNPKPTRKKAPKACEGS